MVSIYFIWVFWTNMLYTAVRKKAIKLDVWNCNVLFATFKLCILYILDFSVVSDKIWYLKTLKYV